MPTLPFLLTRAAWCEEGMRGGKRVVQDAPGEEHAVLLGGGGTGAQEPQMKSVLIVFWSFFAGKKLF